MDQQTLVGCAAPASSGVRSVASWLIVITLALFAPAPTVAATVIS